MKDLKKIVLTVIVSTLAIMVASMKLPTGPESRIIGGEFAEEGQFPYIVLVTVFGGVWSETRYYFCDGSIIGPKWVLTAGHCYSPTTNQSEPITYHIEAGGIRRGEPRQTDVVINDNFFQHPGFFFDGFNLENDIGLMKTKRWTFDDYVCPIQIALGSWDAKSYVGEKLLVMGYGYISNDGPASRELRWIKVTVISRKKCLKYFVDVINTNTAFCAMDLENDPIEKSACSGDSGGPAVIKRDGKLVQIGITSYGHEDGCTAAPIGYTNVALFYDWIILTMAQN